MEAAAANGVTCLEWAGAKMTFAPRYEEGDDEESEYDDDLEDLDDDEEYVDLEDDDVPEDTEEDTVHKELDFKAPGSELPRPLALNREYDEWSAAMAPPVFSEKE